MCALSALSSTKSVVLPARSRQISTGICSSDKPRFDALPPPLAGRTRHPELLAFERFEEEGFIRFGNACKARGLLPVGQGEKTVAPAECRVAMHVTGYRALAHALSFGHLLRVFQPPVFVAQTGEWRARKSIERGLAGATAIAQSRCRPPVQDMLMTTTGAHRLRNFPAFHQAVYRLSMPDLTQSICQNISLVGRQFLKFVSQSLKFFGFHRITYLSDSVTFSIGQHLTVT
jgi:hypothetical protein